MSHQPTDSSIASTFETWMWSILFAITFVVATFPVSNLAYQISQHHAVWFLQSPPSKGLERTLESELLKSWDTVRPQSRPQWIFYRTPISLYLATVMTCLGPICSYAARRKWHRDAFFILLGVVAVAVATFHVWTGNPLASPQHFAMWPILMFPASLLITIWLMVLLKEQITRRRGRAQATMLSSPTTLTTEN